MLRCLDGVIGVCILYGLCLDVFILVYSDRNEGNDSEEAGMDYF